MGLFLKSDLDKLIKHLNKKEINFKKEDDKISFELVMKNKNFMIYPYMTIDDDVLSMCINLSKVDKINNDLCEKINEFNLKSKFFTLKIKNHILFIEANQLIDDINLLFDKMVENLFELEDELDNL